MALDDYQPQLCPMSDVCQNASTQLVLLWKELEGPVSEGGVLCSSTH